MSSQASVEKESVLGDSWEMVIGLEVHVELATNTKLFCSCANRFGDEPNTNICPVCLGLPGSLPVPNGKAIQYAMRLGRALGCEVKPSIFARKNYFYPDMPKDYQTSQYDKPTNIDGHLKLASGKHVRIERAHIEEDTGKSTHLGGGGRIHDATSTLVDYNRAGVPLVEIVTHPDLSSADEAREYVSELRDILLAIEVSDARMEEGSMRVDANVSVRPTGSDELRTRCEIKNINSLRSLVRAINYEARRHVDLWQTGEGPKQETRHWDEAGGRTTSGRSKEDAEDYRYFACPDLPPLVPSAKDIKAIDEALPKLPAERREALATAAGLDHKDVVLAVERGLDTLAVGAIAAGANADAVMKHVDQNLSEGQGQLTVEALAKLVQMEQSGALSSTQTKTVLAALVADGGDPEKIASDLGFEAMDTCELETMIKELAESNPDEWQRFVEGDRKVQGFFVGQIMKATRGQADGKVVNQLMGKLAKAAS